MDFYAQPLTLRAQIEITCDYGTASVTEPVLPCWGTRDERLRRAMHGNHAPPY